jgi:hypothetical protein
VVSAARPITNAIAAVAATVPIAILRLVSAVRGASRGPLCR